MIARIALLACLMAGLLAIALIGPRVAVVAAVAGLACCLAPLLAGAARRVPWTAVTVAALTACAATAEELPDGVACALAYLLAHRRLARRNDRDDRVAVLLSGLMLVLSATVTESPVLGAAVLCWAMSCPGALAGADGEPRWRSHATWAAGVALWMAFLYTVLPRPEVPRRAAPPPALGFDDRVEMGDLAALLDDPTVALRVRVRAAGPVEGPLFLRGVALDRFDGAAWSASGRRVAYQPRPWGEGEALWLDVVREPTREDALFWAGSVQRLEVDPGVRVLVDDDLNLSVSDAARRLRYSVAVSGGLRPGEVTPDLSSPPPDTLVLPAADPRLVALAERLGRGRAPAEQVRAIAAWLSTAPYSRREVFLGPGDPLVRFVLDRPAAHCGYFASGVAVLARLGGLSARVVTGFAVGSPGEPLPEGWFAVRRSHAHAWAEVYLPGQGWLVVDATPGPGGPSVDLGRPSVRERAESAWRAILEYDRAAQVAVVRGTGQRALGALPGDGRDGDLSATMAGAIILVGTGAAFAAGAGWLLAPWVRRLGGAPVPRAEPRAPIAALHARARVAVARAGFDVPGDLPPLSAARWVAVLAPELGRELEVLVWLHYRARYGGADGGALLPEAREAVAAIERIASHLRRVDVGRTAG